VLAWPVLAWPVLAWPVLAWPVLAWRGLSQATACFRADRTAAVWKESAIQQPFSECFALIWAALTPSLTISAPSKYLAMPGVAPQADTSLVMLRSYMLQTRCIERRFTLYLLIYTE
jgi:hypothetical protein